MEQLSVLVHGVLGKMGQEVLSALCQAPQLKAVAGVDIKASSREMLLPDGSGTIPLSTDLDSILSNFHPDVLVDFTYADASMAAVRTAVKHDVKMVIGTTGLSDENLDEIRRLCRDNGIGAVVTPNFSIAAVVMIHLAALASKYFDNAEIIEMHHDQKADAPSGTSIVTARGMIQSRGKPFTYAVAKNEVIKNSRGGEYEGIGLHSVRLPGLLAHQEIILGARGQTLRIRLDQINRECFMDGVTLAIKKTMDLKEAVFGLDEIMGL